MLADFSMQDVSHVQACALKTTALTARMAYDEAFASEFVSAAIDRNPERIRDLLERAGLSLDDVDIESGSQRICFRLGRWTWCLDIDWIG
jgi:hypothetical protein